MRLFLKNKKKKLQKFIATIVLICLTSTLGGLGVFYPKTSHAILGIADIEVGSTVTAFLESIRTSFDALKQMGITEIIERILWSAAQTVNNTLYKNVTKEFEDAYLIKDWSQFARDIAFDVVMKSNNKLLENGKISKQVYKVLPIFESFFVEKVRDQLADEGKQGFGTKTLTDLAHSLVITPDAMTSAVGNAGYFVKLADLANNNAFSEAVHLTTWAVDRTVEADKERQAEVDTGDGYKSGRGEIEPAPQNESDGLVLQTQLSYKPAEIIANLQKMNYKNVSPNLPESTGEFAYDSSYKFDSGIDLTINAGKLEVQVADKNIVVFIFTDTNQGEPIKFVKNQEIAGGDIANQLRGAGFSQTSSVPNRLEEGEFTISPTPYQILAGTYLDYFIQTNAFGLVKIVERVKNDVDDSTNEYIDNIYKNYNTDNDEGEAINEIVLNAVSNLTVGNPERLHGLVKIYEKQWADKTLPKYIIAPMQKGGGYDHWTGLLTQPATTVNQWVNNFLDKRFDNLTDKNAGADDAFNKTAGFLGDIGNFLGSGLSSGLTTETDINGCPVVKWQGTQFKEQLPKFNDVLTQKLSTYPKCFANTTLKTWMGSVDLLFQGGLKMVPQALCAIVTTIPGVGHFVKMIGLCKGSLSQDRVGEVVEKNVWENIFAALTAQKKTAVIDASAQYDNNDPAQYEQDHPWDVKIPFEVPDATKDRPVYVRITGITSQEKDTDGRKEYKYIHLAQYSLNQLQSGKHIFHWNGMGSMTKKQLDDLDSGWKEVLLSLARPGGWIPVWAFDQATGGERVTLPIQAKYFPAAIYAFVIQEPVGNNGNEANFQYLQAYNIDLPSEWDYPTETETLQKQVGARLYVDDINVINQEGNDAIKAGVVPGEKVKIYADFTNNGIKDLNVKYALEDITSEGEALLINEGALGDVLKANAVKTSNYNDSQAFVNAAGSDYTVQAPAGVNSVTYKFTIKSTNIETQGDVQEITIDVPINYELMQKAPQADFSFSVAFAGMAQFTNKTIGYGDINYKWDFGDPDGERCSPNHADPYTYPSPCYIYHKKGEKLVKLTATNEYGSDSVEKTIVIKDFVMKFSYKQPDAGSAKIVFKNQSDELYYIIQEESWQFGDNEVSGLITDPKQEVEHIYQLSDPNKAQDFEVYLTVWAYDETATTKQKITVYPALLPDFEAAVPKTNQYQIKFTDKSLGIDKSIPGKVKWEWNFGYDQKEDETADNNTKTIESENGIMPPFVQNFPRNTTPRHHKYTVTLTVTNQAGMKNSVQKVVEYDR